MERPVTTKENPRISWCGSDIVDVWALYDGLKGVPEAIESVYPEPVVQTCIVHLIRHSLAVHGVEGAQAAGGGAEGGLPSADGGRGGSRAGRLRGGSSLGAEVSRDRAFVAPRPEPPPSRIAMRDLGTENG